MFIGRVSINKIGLINMFTSPISAVASRAMLNPDKDIPGTIHAVKSSEAEYNTHLISSSIMTSL